MKSTIPRVSIGLPVYNGELYLEYALDSILAQSFDDFEVIIADNASEDRTEQICRDYACRDARVRYVRNETNLGASANFNRTFALARGPYFKWAAHDDVLGTDFLLRCVEVLDSNPDVVLCHTKTQQIDEEGRVVGNYDFEMRINSDEPAQRFRDLIIVRHNCVLVFGVLRSEVLKRTPLIGDYVASDRCLLAELALFGKLYELPDYLFLRRDHPMTSVRSLVHPHERLAWFNTAMRNRLSFPEWRVGYEHMKSVCREAPLTLSTRVRCLAQVFPWVTTRWRWLLWDILTAARVVLSRTRAGAVLLDQAKRAVHAVGVRPWKFINRGP